MGVYEGGAVVLCFVACHLGTSSSSLYPIRRTACLAPIPQVPSSINRVYSLIHPSLVSVGFTYASGIVLPLMGFWNSVIYITTSWTAVRMLFSGRLGGNGAGSRAPLAFARRSSLNRRRTGSVSDSVKGLKPAGMESGYDQV